MSWYDRDSIRNVVDRVELRETDDGGSQQLVRALGLADEEFRKALRVNPHGFTSHSPRGSEGVVLLGGGRRDRPVILGLEHPDHRRRGLEEGEAVLYDDQEQVVFLKRDGVHIRSRQDVVRVAKENLRVILRDKRWVQLKIVPTDDPEEGAQALMHLTLDLLAGKIIASHAIEIGPDPNPQD